jgi:micrococcal nuclease
MAGLAAVMLTAVLAYRLAFDPLSAVPDTQTVSVRGPGAYEVVDGDTIRAAYGIKYRLMGYDAPETYQAKCDAERELGRRAAARLTELMASGDVRVMESGRLDKYGRTLAHLTVNGKDVGQILIKEGLARSYSGGKRGDWCR